VKPLFELLDDYQVHRQARGYSPETLYKGRRNLLGFLRWLATVHQVTTSGELGPRHLEAWQKRLHGYRTGRGLPFKPLSINKLIESVRGFLKFLTARGHVPGVLNGVLCSVKKPILLPTSVLTHAQVRKLLAHIPTSDPQGYRDRTLLELLYSTGIRRKEALQLKLTDIDFGHATALVMGKGSKQRVVPVGRTAMRHLETYVKAVRPFLQREASDQDLFLDRTGKVLTGPALRVRLLRYAASLDVPFAVTPHTFRRSCATELIRGGANLYHVKDLLGHEDLDTLKHYVKLTIADLKKTHEKCHPRERDE